MKTTKESVQFLRDCEASNPEIRRGNASIRQSQLHVSDVMVQFANSDTMENKIKEVQDYFKQKLIKGEYEGSDFNDSYFTATIDGPYNFIIWVGNEGRYCRTWNAIGNFFMVLPEFNPIESAEMFTHASRIMAENSKRITAEKIEKLESELNKLKGGRK